MKKIFIYNCNNENLQRCKFSKDNVIMIVFVRLSTILKRKSKASKNLFTFSSHFTHTVELCNVFELVVLYRILH